MKKIIDTNVPIIANGDKSPQASKDCQGKCIQLVRDVIEFERIQLVIDLQRLVLTEYARHLRPARNTRLGDRFLLWILQHLGSEQCVLVYITQAGDSFVEFPNDDERLSNFDPADRKWIAVALAYGRDYQEIPPIAQASDLKWKDFVGPFADHGIGIEFICD